MLSYKRAAMALVVGLLLSLAPAAWAQRRIIIVRPVHPFFYDPFWYPYPPYPPGYYVQNVGYVKIDTERKDAQVFVDGGYAGLAGKVKKFPLRPGSHDIVLKDRDGRSIYQERVAVILGKTTKIRVG
ncbi:MAG TPA: hypothetical protein VE825_14010 [Terriglobales bacterium]|jgi:hypothetical protein|nr:hypothetical protein [Terriglobales bacterium]